MECWDLGAGSWEMGAESWELGAGSWELGAGSWENHKNLAKLVKIFLLIFYSNLATVAYNFFLS